MPVATFPGERGWGYDGLYTSAPHPAYGGPHGLARLVDAAHAAGPRRDPRRRLQPRRSRLRGARARSARTSPTATRRSGATRLDYSQRGVREWAIQNAEQWVRDFHVDGLRLDAVHAIFDDVAAHVWPSCERSSASADALVIAEMDGRRPAADRGAGATTRSGPTSSTTRCTSCSPASATATTRGYGAVAVACGDLDGRGRRSAPRDLRPEPRPGGQPRRRRPAARGGAPRWPPPCTLFAP